MAGANHKSRDGASSTAEERFSKIDGKHTYEEDLKNTNPCYSPQSFEWSYNCQRCVSAYEARRRGYNVTALPAKLGDDELSQIYPLEKGIFSPYKGVEPQNVSANSGTQARIVIEDCMEMWGNGARAIVCVQWKAGGGHAFIAERVNGHTRFIDPQTGSTHAENYFEYAKGQGAYCGRIDNVPFTSRITKCCTNVK